MEDNMGMVGKAVCNIYGQTIRYGLVESEEMRGKWKYCKVNWVDDHKYEDSIKHMQKMRNDGKDYTRHVYRVDQLRLVNIDRQINMLRILKNEKINGKLEEADRVN